VTGVLASGVFKGLKNMPKYTMVIQANAKGMVYLFGLYYHLLLLLPVPKAWLWEEFLFQMILYQCIYQRRGFLGYTL